MNNAIPLQISPKQKAVILQSLRAGVTPHIGLQHIQVGRNREISALELDLQNIASGGTAVRFIIGEFGSGKSFFLQLVREIALSMELVTLHSDLSPQRRLYGTGGEARSLYNELLTNLSTRSKPEGKALENVVEKFINSAQDEAQEQNQPTEKIIRERLKSLEQYNGGYDFSKVITAYWRGYEESDENLQKSAIRWLKGEYSTRTEARTELDVRTIVDDASVFDQLKLLAQFVVFAGYKGLLVTLDEMINLYKLSNAISRKSNYEQILRIVNNCLQGGANHIGFLMGGTPEFLTDSRKGLYSYEALRSRLSENSFAQNAKVIDYHQPVLRLANLSDTELHLLLRNLLKVQALGDARQFLVPDEAIVAFMTHCNQKIGSDYFRTPRNTIKAFLDLLAVLEQNPNLKWDELISAVKIEKETVSDLKEIDDAPDLENKEPQTSENGQDNSLTSFRL